MLTLTPQQETGYAPLEHGQIIEINPSCMKVNFGFRFIRGVFTGLIMMFISGFTVFGLAVEGSLAAPIGFIEDFKDYYLHIGLVVFLELYLWPSAPPMVFDRVNRRVIFQVLFRTKIIAWDDCVASIHHFVQASAASASQGYNLRIEGDTINRKPGQKPQRAVAMIHQSGISDDLLNYWEYLRHYMEGGPDAVPEPIKLHERNPFAAAWYGYKRNYAGLTFAKLSWVDFKQPGRPLHKRAIDLFIVVTAPMIMLLALPLVVPMYMMAAIAAKLGRVRRYPKEIRELCKTRSAKAKSSTTKAPAPRKPVIRVNGKLADND